MPLKMPICTFDAKTGILCAMCKDKLRSGQLGEADILASGAMVRLAESVGDLNKVTLVRSFESEGNYLLEVEPAGAPGFRLNPVIVQKLAQMLNGEVWVLGTTESDRRFLEDLFYPIRILTVSVVWLPDGSKLTKLIIPWRRGDKLPREFEALRKLAKKARGIELMIETEREAALRL